MHRRPPGRSLVSTRPPRGPHMKAIQPAKALLIAAVIGLGLSGGFAAAALLPGGSAPAALSQLWDSTVGRSLENGPGDKGSVFTAAATYIGITEAQLRTELGTDKSLADVAVAHGTTRDGLVAAIVADSTAKIDAAQKAGTITADQATQLKTNLSTRIAQLVDSNRPGFGRGFPFGPGR